MPDPPADSVEPFDESQLTADPMELFHRWYDDASRHGVGDWMHVDAMTLATVDSDARPHARIVLYKQATSRGFVFFTNYGSEKSRQLDANPQAALVFHWSHRQRQIRVEGRVQRTDRAISERYFHSRPRGSQLGAHASPQSQAISGRAELIERYQQLEREFDGGPVPLPDDWGGYELTADRIEFWQSGDDRLHDRFRYRYAGDGWSVERLAP